MLLSTGQSSPEADGRRGSLHIAFCLTQFRVAVSRFDRSVNIAAPGPVRQELAALFVARSGGAWGAGDLISVRSLGPAWLSDYMPACIVRFYGNAGLGFSFVRCPCRRARNAPPQAGPPQPALVATWPGPLASCWPGTSLLRGLLPLQRSLRPESPHLFTPCRRPNSRRSAWP